MITRNTLGRALSCACIIYLATAAAAVAASTAATEAGPGASPKVIACMTACEQTQMTCLQGALQTPVEKRTIKDINTARACNRAEERCDHRCRSNK
jgi:C4-dicarboxylate transporter